MKRVLMLCLLAVVPVWAAGVAPAAQEAPPLQVHHTAWLTADGAPGPVFTLTQTPDGWLWLGTSTGLFRFDGVRFERIDALGGRPLPSSAVRRLACGPDGSLWIGYLFGGASRWHDGKFTHYGAAQGLPHASLVKFAFGADGTVWAAAAKALYRLQGDRWQPVGDDSFVVDVIVTRKGNHLWIKAHDQLLLWAAGTPRPRVVAPAVFDDASTLAEGPDGTVWDSDGQHGLRRFDSEGRPLPLPPSLTQRAVEPLLFARDGSAWYAEGGAVHRMAPGDPAAAPRQSLAQTLSRPQVQTLFEDREGTLWIGTTGGLDRIRANRLQRQPLPAGTGGPVVAPASAHEVWIGIDDGRLLQADGGVARERANVKAEVSAAHRTADGALWVGSGDGRVWRVVADAPPKPLVSIPQSAASVPVQALAEDTQRRLWVSKPGVGLLRLETDGSWSRWGGRDGLPDDMPTVLQPDPQGRLWAGFTQDRVAVVDAGGRPRVYGRDEGVAVGAVTAVTVRGPHTWIGGETGVQALVDGRFRTLLAADGGFHGVTGIVERADGELWLYGAEGAARLPADQVARFLAAPDHRPAVERFDQRDGLPGPPNQIRPLPTLVEGDDGRLWFHSETGVSWIDPRRIHRNPLPPPVQVLGVRLGDTVWPARDGLALPAGTRQLTLDYTALALEMPERVQFRYRLDGIDNDWQSGATRRNASYANLGPGRYVFRVTASNSDGVWSDTPATLAFSIAPAFHQTAWFRSAAGVALLALLAVLYRWRTRQLARRATEHLRVQQRERDRIAADLHDTLLQGIYALLLRVQTVAARAGEPPVREGLEEAMQDAERLVAEGRDRVAGLRHPDTPTELPRALRHIVSDIGRSHGTPGAVQVEGEPRELAPEVVEQLCLIGREAVFNVAVHAQATRFDVRLDYGAEALRLHVRDDGKGLPPEVLQRGGLEGHWGLAGMRERAERLQGRLQVHSVPGGGTEVVVEVPAARAYRAVTSRPGPRGTNRR